MRIKQDEPFEIQPRANGAMARALQVSAALAFVLSLVGVLVPGDVGEGLAWAAVAVVVAVPLARVAWLCLRWIRRRDLVFAAIAGALLLVVAVGGTVALVQGN